MSQLDKIVTDTLSESELDTVLEQLEALTAKTALDYKPHPKQLSFHCADKKFRLMIGGNRSGKTEAGTLEAVFHATGNYPEWYPKEKRLNGPNRGRIVVTDYAKGCGETLEPKLLSWLPNELIIAKRRTLKGFLEKLSIRHKSGGVSTIDIMTHEQDDAQFEGWSGHWAWFDEPPPREKFVATMRGLIDYAGRMWFTLTPISEPWLYDEFIDKHDDNVFTITVHQDDNPYILDEEKRIYRSRLTEEEIEARVCGKFKHLTGLIYKEFDESVHLVSEKAVTIDKRWPVYFVLDPADRRPHHAIWARVNPFGDIYIVDELVFKGTILETSKEILKREITNGIRPLDVVRILDPNKGETPSAVSGLTLKKEFASHAVYFITKVNDDIALGHLAVKERLSYDKSQKLSTTNHPKLFFVKENTRECVRQIRKYVWDDWSGRSRDSKSEKEHPKDINKDMPDCLRYLVVYNPMYYNQKDETDPVPRSSSITGYH